MTKSIYSASYKRLLNLLVRAREERGLTQVQIATAIGKPQSFVSKAESGERRLDIVELLQILDALRVDPVEFLRSYLRRKE
jgi:transcriptional regulator with XRE-family HTH domain